MNDTPRTPDQPAWQSRRSGLDVLQHVRRPLPHETQSLESRFPTLSPAAIQFLKVEAHHPRAFRLLIDLLQRPDLRPPHMRMAVCGPNLTSGT